MTLFAVIISILSIIWLEVCFFKDYSQCVIFFFMTCLLTRWLDCSVRIYHFIIITNANWLAPMSSSSHYRLPGNLMILRSRLFRAIWTFIKTPSRVLFFFNQWCIIFKLVPISKIHNILTHKCLMTIIYFYHAYTINSVEIDNLNVLQFCRFSITI